MPFDLDEARVVGDVADLALDHGARRVLLGHALPGVLLDLLHPEGDLLLVLVDLQDLHQHLLLRRHHLRRVVDPLGPGHLRDVHQPLDALFELHEARRRT